MHIWAASYYPEFHPDSAHSCPVKQLKLRPVIYIQFMLKLETTFFCA